MNSTESASCEHPITRRGQAGKRNNYLTPLCAVALLAASQQLAAQSPNQSLGLSAAGTLRLHIDDRGLDIDARNVALSEVLSQLSDQAGIRLRYSKRRLGQTTVSLSLHDTPLDKAIALILRGHSYLLNLDEQARTLVVLSTGRGTNTGPVVPKRIELHNSKTRADVSPFSSKDKKSPNETAASSSEPTPDTVIADLSDENADEVPELAPSMAMEQLASMDRPDATELIMRATSDNSNAVDRALAADALWQHASDRNFADAEVNQALERLANDSDESVRNIAEQAVSDMQAHRNKAQ